jgi:Effector-associated domain 1
LSAKVLDHQARECLCNELCARYPSYDEFHMFLSFKLNRSLAQLAAPDALESVIFKVVETAEACGWIRALVTAAASDSQHRPLLQQLVSVLPPVPSPSIAEAVAVRELVMVLLVPLRWESLAVAVRADHRVRRLASFTTAEAARDDLHEADALVVSTEIVWSAARPRPRLRAALPVVLLETQRDQTSPVRHTVAHDLAGLVTQIVVGGDPQDTARRIVDHVASVVRTSR